MTIVWIVLAFIVLWTILLVPKAIVTIDTGSIGLAFRFKKFNRKLNDGLNFIIPLIEKVEIHSTQTHQDEFPEDPEWIDRVSDTPEAGMRLPYRIMQSGLKTAIFYIEKDRNDPTRVANDLETHYMKARFKDLPEEMKKALEEDAAHAPLTAEISVAVEWNLDGENERSLHDFI